MPGDTSQPIKNTGQNPTAGPGSEGPLPQFGTTLEQNVVPVVIEAQRLAAESSVSGRRAVSRGTIFLAFYLWILSGAILFSFIARYTQLFPGDKLITHRLQKQQNRWFHNFMLGISEFGFPKLFTPITLGIAAIFWALRFRLESIFILLTSTSSILNWIVKHLIKRPRPTKELVTVVRVINEPSFHSGHVMHYMNFFGLMIYLLATNWRSGKLRNLLIAICTSLIALIGPSRVDLRAHWPSDVVAGYIYGGLGFPGSMTGYLVIKRWEHTPHDNTAR